MTSVPARDFPLRLAPPGAFRLVEAALRGAGFEEAAICRTLKITELSTLGSAKRDDIDFASVAEGLALFIKLFLFGELVSRVDVERLLDTATLDACLALDLIRHGEFDNESYASPVFLYPVADLYIASDRHHHPDGSPFVPPPDIVFPAIFAGTLRFLRLLSKRPAESALDLCAGSGIGALTLSRHVKSVVTADITPRATHFASFNKLLNRCDNVEVAQGDLYDAIPGRTFERIVAHPPYVPSLGDVMIFRDGGEAGETIIRRLVEGLPQHLRPGGTFSSLGLGLDTAQGRFEERARVWLGGARIDFDNLFGVGDEKSPEQVVEDIMKRAKGIGSASGGRLLEVFKSLGTIRCVYGALVIHRRAGKDGEPWTGRSRLSTRTDGEGFDWLLAWHRRMGRADAPGWLCGARPSLSPALRLQVTHRVQEGELVPASFLLETDKPLATAMRIDPWVIPLIARFDGARTPAALHQAAQTAGEAPADFGLSDFARLVALLIERGYLVLKE